MVVFENRNGHPVWINPAYVAAVDTVIQDGKVSVDESAIHMAAPVWDRRHFVVKGSPASVSGMLDRVGIVSATNGHPPMLTS